MASCIGSSVVMESVSNGRSDENGGFSPVEDSGEDSDFSSPFLVILNTSSLAGHKMPSVRFSVTHSAPLVTRALIRRHRTRDSRWSMNSRSAQKVAKNSGLFRSCPRGPFGRRFGSR